MKAAGLYTYKDAASLRCADAPMPQPAAGQVLVQVHAAGVTPTELLWLPTSRTRDGTPRPLPVIPGHELSGTVAAVGAGVDGFRSGDAVYGLNDWFADGASAEYCLASPAELAAKPASLDHLHAAVVPISGLTAWQGLIERAGLQRGQRVLIHGGAGAVGVFAVQLARWRGAQVLTTVSPANADFVRGLGADHAIDYATTRFEAVARDVDVVFDLVGGDTLQRSWAVLKPGGRLLTIAADAEGTTDERVRNAFFIVEPNSTQLGELARLIDAGTLRAFVDTEFPLSDVAAAFQHRTRRGKAVLRIREA